MILLQQNTLHVDCKVTQEKSGHRTSDCHIASTPKKIQVCIAENFCYDIVYEQEEVYYN